LAKKRAYSRREKEEGYIWVGPTLQRGGLREKEGKMRIPNRKFSGYCWATSILAEGGEKQKSRGVRGGTCNSAKKGELLDAKGESRRNFRSKPTLLKRQKEAHGSEKRIEGKRDNERGRQGRRCVLGSKLEGFRYSPKKKKKRPGYRKT